MSTDNELGRLLAGERDRFRDALRDLSDACERYDALMGWDGERAYSKTLQ